MRKLVVAAAVAAGLAVVVGVLDSGGRAARRPAALEADRRGGGLVPTVLSKRAQPSTGGGDARPTLDDAPVVPHSPAQASAEGRAGGPTIGGAAARAVDRGDESTGSSATAAPPAAPAASDPAVPSAATVASNAASSASGSATGASGATGSSASTSPSSVGAATSPTGVTAASGTTGPTAASDTSGPSGPTSTAGPSDPPQPTVAVAAAPANGPVGDPGGWHLIFDDEFAAGGLDSSKWSTGWYGSGITGPISPGDELSCYDPSEVTVAGGELDLGIVARREYCHAGDETIAQPYATGFVSTQGRFSFSYGFLEARLWLPASTSGTIADWPTFWTVGQDWPADGELDVLEGLKGLACWHFHDPAGGPGGCSNATFTGGWHTFGADWEPGTVTWYYDGVAVGSLSKGVTGAPMDVNLGLSVDDTEGGPIVTNTELRVDYVRVWQH